MASKILVIEDDRALRNAVVSALQSGGHEVEFAADGSAGVQAPGAKTFDVVLLDIGLPFVDGWHVLSTLEGRRVPSVIVISARGDQADKVHALDMGADDYLAKPFGSRNCSPESAPCFGDGRRLTRCRSSSGQAWFPWI